MDGGRVENAGAINRPDGSMSVIKARHITPLTFKFKEPDPLISLLSTVTKRGMEFRSSSLVGYLRTVKNISEKCTLTPFISVS